MAGGPGNPAVGGSRERGRQRTALQRCGRLQACRPCARRQAALQTPRNIKSPPPSTPPHVVRQLVPRHQLGEGGVHVLAPVKGPCTGAAGPGVRGGGRGKPGRSSRGAGGRQRHRAAALLSSAHQQRCTAGQPLSGVRRACDAPGSPARLRLQLVPKMGRQRRLHHTPSSPQCAAGAHCNSACPWRPAGPNKQGAPAPAQPAPPPPPAPASRAHSSRRASCAWWTAPAWRRGRPRRAAGAARPWGRARGAAARGRRRGARGGRPRRSGRPVLEGE